jgi:predicted ATPase/class 3 adenylate cyclase
MSLPIGPRVTFLFTDIEGSTRQWELSPAMHDQVEAHFAALRAAIGAAGGVVFSTMGDGVAAAFGSAEGAVHAAVVAQRELLAGGLAVRMGLHTGEAEAVGDDFRGRPVNRAARIMAAGHGGQILLSDVSAALVRSGPNPVGLLDLGSHRLRDLLEPERLWQVVHPELPQAFRAVRGVDTYVHNLPAQRSSLVGRDADVRRVTTLMPAHRIVTLTGVGGVGKTRLAVHAAADLLSQYANVWFVDLATVRQHDDVAAALALTVGAAAAVDSLPAAVALLGRERTLLVVDNCEHVVDGAASVIDAVTAACPGVSVIATSREALGIDGEHVVPVGTLDPSSTAIELFRQRAAAAGADMGGVDHAAIEELCWRLDGIPLAIELAAARSATLGVAAITGALHERLDLHGGRRRGGDRHATMRATIEWSYRLLHADEQRMLEWLAVFPSGFELDAAVHVAAAMGIGPDDATDHVSSLAHKSMVTPEPHDRGVRYRMLETVRAFASEQLAGRGGRAAAMQALASWMTTLTDLPYTECCSAAVERNAIRLEREADNWREAVLWAAHAASGDLAARLCGPPVAYFLLGRHDLADIVPPLLAHCVDPRHRRAVLCALTVCASGATDAAQLVSWADEIEEIEAIEPTGLGGLMQWLALAWQGAFEESVQLCVERSLDERYDPSTRDLFLGIAVLDRFSLTDASGDPHGLIGRALDAADRSDVALVRVTCLLGAAWGLAGSEPERSLHLVRRALDDIPNLPGLTRVTMPGSASRLLTRLDPRIAALGLLDQLDATPSRRSFVDLIPLFYAASLLHRAGHPSGDATSTLEVARVAPYLSMMDSLDFARRVSATSNAGSLEELEAVVRAALREIAGGA